jgi:hypothetical protein
MGIKVIIWAIVLCVGEGAGVGLEVSGVACARSLCKSF